MRTFLFNAVAQTSAGIIWFLGSINVTLLRAVGNAGYLLMRLIDSQKLAVYEQLMEQSAASSGLQTQAMELRLLASASQVRDHARETNDWTDRHTEALNAIGDALISEAGWQEDSVHQYLKELVESIDGLEYGTEEW